MKHLVAFSCCLGLSLIFLAGAYQLGGPNGTTAVADDEAAQVVGGNGHDYSTTGGCNANGCDVHDTYKTYGSDYTGYISGMSCPGTNCGTYYRFEDGEK